MSLVTWALTPDSNGRTRLMITDRVTSTAGGGAIEGSRHGYTAMLDKLDTHLATRQ